MPSLKKVEEKVLAVKALRLMKRLYTYRELERITGIATPILARYCSGRNLPNIERAREILHIYRDMNVLYEYLRPLTKKSLINTIDILTDPDLLELIVHEIRMPKVHKIIVPEANGIPIATMLSMKHGVKFVIMKARREQGVEDFISVSATVPNTGFQITFHIPRGSIKRNERVFFVDDVIRTGTTLHCAKELVRKSKGMFVGAFAIFKRKGLEAQAIVEF